VHFRPWIHKAQGQFFKSGSSSNEKRQSSSPVFWGDGARSAGPKKWRGREAMASVELSWRLGWCGLRGASGGKQVSQFSSLVTSFGTMLSYGRYLPRCYFKHFRKKGGKVTVEVTILIFYFIKSEASFLLQEDSSSSLSDL
jgi:hypothetical protein